MRKLNGDESFELPISVTYILGRDRTILTAFVDLDFTKRLDLEQILDILERPDSTK